jgi:hypothetical protein
VLGRGRVASTGRSMQQVGADLSSMFVNRFDVD